MHNRGNSQLQAWDGKASKEMGTEALRSLMAPWSEDERWMMISFGKQL